MALEKLLYLRGVGASYTDYMGQELFTSQDDREGILKCMLAIDPAAPLSTEQLCQEIYSIDAQPWTELVQGFQWCYADTLSLDVYLPQTIDSQKIEFEIITESEQQIRFSCHSHDLAEVGNYWIGSSCYLHYRIELKVYLSSDELSLISCGYHQVRASLATEESATKQAEECSGLWMVAPKQAFQVNDRVYNEQVPESPLWGISVQLYSVRSAKQWGMGDFNDLSDIIERIAPLGADFIQLNPLHALDGSQPEEASPYSPNDRRFLNPLYIHVQSVAEYKVLQSAGDSVDVVELWQKQQAHLNCLKSVDYSNVAAVKNDAFVHLYQLFKQSVLSQDEARRQNYQHFITAGGAALANFCEYESARSGKYPADFYCYLQFVAQDQLAACQIKAKQSGMTIGLIRDLAVGAKGDGFEISSNSSLFCQQASIGAPPDPFAEHGQNWGLPPLDPIALKQQNYRHLIELVRSNLSACGGLRIDHVMSMYRLWWWPNDPANGKGAYVHYPAEVVLAIFCLESHRAQTVLIGEDLGLVPAEMSQLLQQASIYSNEVFYFCKTGERFSQPENYKKHSLMMLANHDVPTLAAWWLGEDLKVKQQLNLFVKDQTLAQAMLERERDKLQLLLLLNATDSTDDSEQTVTQSQLDKIKLEQLIPRWILATATGKSALYCLQLCDLALEIDSVNIPGTWQEYPNWQRRNRLSIDEILTTPWVQQTLAQLSEARAGRKD